ncbi:MULTISPECIES: type I-E CRISPR-associated protein Cas7/Cse4/CasC [unclassified Streptomyces]|uniref:type I-E CRISPR-associated protein Cas7/Cse4/CasC n=1 Tax=unclassified Streptomyces TaxID=2593676 RepID=UPI0033A429E8
MTIDPTKQFLSLHSLTTFSHVLLVRDDAGEPKTSFYGDELRTILPAQTQRRADRMHMRDAANLGTGPLASHAWGVRTREWALRIAEALESQHAWSKPEALETARTVLRGTGLKFGSTPSTAYLTKVMVFAPETTGITLAKIIHKYRKELTEWMAAVARIESAEKEAGKSKGRKGRAAEEVREIETPAEEPDSQAEPGKVPPLPGKIKRELVTGLAPADAIDIALYGRFMAEVADAGNVDGAIQTITSFSVDRAAIVRDFFSAADDFKIIRQRQGRDFTNALAAMKSADPFDAEPASVAPVADDRGAGMTGYQSFFNGTFYAHSVLDRIQLRRNLANGGMAAEEVERAARDAERALLDAFVNAVPSAKKNTTAAPGTLPKLVLAHEAPRPYNYAAVYEEAIRPENGTPSIQAVQRLLQHHAMITKKRGLAPGTILTYDIAVSELLDEHRLAGRLGPTEVHHPGELSPLTAGQPA